MKSNTSCVNLYKAEWGFLYYFCKGGPNPGIYRVNDST